MQIGKSTPLPHRIAYSIIPCCIYVCVPISVWHADFCLCFPQTCILSHRMLEWCRTAFICVRPLSHDASWLPTFGLPCPVSLCSNHFPFPWQRPCFPPLSFFSLLLHSCDLFLSLWSRSDRHMGETRRGRQEYRILLCADTLGLSPPALYLTSVGSYVEHYGGLW